MKISLQDFDLNDKEAVLSVYELLVPSLKKFGIISSSESTQAPSTDDVSANTQSADSKSGYTEFICRHREGTATVHKIIDPETLRARYVIKKGSKIKLYCAKNDTPYGIKRKELFKKGTISESGEVMEDVDDDLTSPSLTASIILGANTNGKTRLVPVD